MEQDNETFLIKKYFKKGFYYDEIRDMLENVHDIKMCKRTLQRKLSDLNLKRKNLKESSKEEIVRAIVHELYSAGFNLGYKSLWHKLVVQHVLIVRRDTVYKYLKIADPEGMANRYGNRLQRRQYINNGPNWCWHLDGYDKLLQFGFGIHGGVNGHSRLILWLEAASTNKDPKVVAYYFLNTVKRLKLLANLVRTDAGTENVMVESLQIALRSKHEDQFAGSKSFIQGKSTANQRIESYWGRMRKHTADFYIQLFKSMREKQLFNDSPLHIKTLQFRFGPVIQYDLDMTKELWNAHNIRKQPGRTNIVCGKPEILYFLPERNKAVDYKKEVDVNVIEKLMDQYTTKPQLFDPKFKELVELILPNYTTPKTPEEALNLYKSILHEIKIRKE